MSGWCDPYNVRVGAYDVTLPKGVVGVAMGKLAKGLVMNVVPSSAPLQAVTLNSRAGYETFARAQNAAFAAASVYHNTMYTVRLNLNNGRTITLRGSTVRAEPIVWKINNPALVKNISAQRTISAGSLVVA